MEKKLLFVIVVLLNISINSQDGVLDNSFGTSGKISTFLSPDLSLNLQTRYSAAVQADDKIIVAGDGVRSGEDQDFFIYRYNVDGTSDNSFGTNGAATFNIGSSSFDDANAVAVQPGGKIVVAGFSHLIEFSHRIISVIRLNSDGTLDNTFDSDGIVTTDIADDEFTNLDEAAEAVAIGSDGKIIVAGNRYDNFSFPSNKSIFICRYNSDGSPDTGFDSDGIVVTDFTEGFDEVNGVAVQTDGKIVVTGRTANSNFDLLIIRYNSDGTLDNSFSTDGYDIIDFNSGDDVGYAVVIQADNKILVAGSAMNTNNDFVLLRYNTDGSPDTDFDGDGIALLDFSSTNDIASSLSVLENGKIIVAGRSGSNYALTRFNSDGSLDTDFGTSGKATTSFGSTGFIQAGARLVSVVVQSDGKIITAGTTFNFTDGPGTSLARFLGSSAPLPVELVSFNAFIQGSNVTLKWETATEVNNYGFEIQRSPSPNPSQREWSSEAPLGGVWGAIGFVKGNGNSNSVKEYSFVDEDVTQGSYLYRLKQIDNDGTFEYSEPIEASFMMPAKFSLEQNYPNPFNPITNFGFRISDFGLVTLKVYDLLGKEVAVLVNEQKEPGNYQIHFDGSYLSSGVYYYTLTASGISITKKFMLLK